jgi:hypothetical protein
LAVEIGGGMHGHRLDPELAARSQNSERDLAAVGDDELSRSWCVYSMTNSG